jgi:hypothetical protein
MPQPGFFVLHPAVLPPLEAGAYTLHVEVEDMPAGGIEPLDAHVTVSAPRFTMPPEQVLSTYPPANASGSFQATLPQIVLKRRTLPWERHPYGPGAAPAPGDEHLPWLALVVIAEGEGSLSGESKVEDCVTPGVSLPHLEDRDTATSVYLSVTQTVLDAVFPTKEDAGLLAHVREVDISDSELLGGDDDGFLSVVIGNRLPQPGFDDKGAPVPRKYLACLINIEGQHTSLPPPTPDPKLGFKFDAAAVVQDLSATTAAYVDHPDRLVMGGPLPVTAVAAPAAGPETTRAAVRTGAAWSPEVARVAAGDGGATVNASELVRDSMASSWRRPIITLERTYRFPVLAHWSFTVSGDPTFEELMLGLDVGLVGTLVGDLPPKSQAELDREKLSAAPPAPARPAPELAETGHVGLQHQTRRGDVVEAWYRGPDSPHPTTREEPDAEGHLPLAHTSDQLRMVVPDGREDVSLAAAFEIGRLLALSQPAVVDALLRWRREQFGAARAAKLAADALAGVAVAAGLPEGGPGLGAMVGRSFVLAAAEHPDAVLAPARPLVDPGRPLTYATGDLDKLVADGLGISLPAITEAAKQVGIVAALADAQVAVASPPEGVLSGPGFAALSGEVDHAVEVVADDVLKTEADGGGHARIDALDRHITTLEEKQ